MASTLFIDKETVIEAAWCNEVNNLVWLVFNGSTSAAEARTALSLGTAALANVTTSQTDTTPDALMKVGAGGLLNTGTAPGLPDLNATNTPTGQYLVNTDTLNIASRPADAPSEGTVRIARYDDLSMEQILSTAGASAQYYRRWTRKYDAVGLAFRGWVEELNTGNVISGTFTPVMTFDGLSTGITYSSQGGIYTKKPVGGGLSEVFVHAYPVLSNKGTATGVARLSLPFSVYNQGSVNIPVVALRCYFVTYSGMIQGYANDTQVLIEQLTEAGAPSLITDANFINTSSVMYSLTYLTED